MTLKDTRNEDCKRHKTKEQNWVWEYLHKWDEDTAEVRNVELDWVQRRAIKIIGEDGAPLL